MFFPLALVAVRASVAQAPVGLEEMARALGCDPWTVLWRVTFRLVAPGLAAAFCLVFLSAVTELTSTLILIPTGAQTLATQFWAYTTGQSYAAAAPYADTDGGHRRHPQLPSRALVQPAPDQSHPTTDMTRLAATDLHKAFGDQSVLTGIDLTVPEGSLTAILGPSGSGKTTLLRVLAGFERSDRGVITLGDRVVEDGRRYVPPEERGIGYVPQEGALFPHLTVEKNIAFGLSRHERRDGRIARLAEMVGLADFVDRYPHQLSGGQQQRVALARALAIEPEVVLLDEPFSSLDAGLRASVRADVQRVLRHAGTTALLVTHDQDEALSMADYVAVIRHGRIGQTGTPQELYEHPVDPAMAEFLGDANLINGSVDSAVASTAARHRCRCARVPTAWPGPRRP